MMGVLYGVIAYFSISLVFGIVMVFSTLGDPKFGYKGALVFGLMCGLSWPVWIWIFWDAHRRSKK